MRSGDTDGLIVTLSVELSTNDDVRRVEDFYAKRVPKNASNTTILVGFATATAFQWDLQDTHKQIMIQRDKDMTLISLQSITRRLPTSSQSATPIVQP